MKAVRRRAHLSVVLVMAGVASLAMSLTAYGTTASVASTVPSSATWGSNLTGFLAASEGPLDSVATGSPINLAMPNLQGSTQGVNLPDTSEAAQAAVDWINHHGGVQGHPLALTVCDLLTTPASDVSCANTIAASNAVAVVAGGVDNADPIVTAVAAANIPFTAVIGSSPQEDTNPDAFAFTGSFPGSSYLVAKSEEQHGGKHVTMVLISAPGAVAAVQTEASPYFALAGVKLKIVATSPTGQSDVAPTLQSALSGGTSGVFLQEDPTTCIAALQAKTTLGVSASIRFYADSSCESAAVVKAAGANANGTYFVGPGAATDQKDPDWPTYNTAMHQYAPGVNLVGDATNGFVGVMDLYRAMLTIPKGTTISAASVKSALQKANGVKAFLGAGTTYTCNGKAIKADPSICSGVFFEDQYRNKAFHYVEYAILPKS